MLSLHHRRQVIRHPFPLRLMTRSGVFFIFFYWLLKFFVFRFAFRIPYSPSHFSSRIIDGLNNPHQQGGSNTSSASAANGGEEEVDVTDDAETNTDPLQVGRTSTSSACNSESETNQLSAHLNK